VKCDVRSREQRAEGRRQREERGERRAKRKIEIGKSSW